MADAAKLGKIFIGGLSYETTDEKLRSYFGAYGVVTDAVVMKDPISRRSRGFGFITYADPICVDRALAQPNHILDGRRVEAKRAVPRAESLRDVGSSSLSSRGSGTNPISGTSVSSAVGTTKKIFVGGLHYETKDADFKKYFMQYGKVVSAEVMFNRETNKSRGFGFVIFESEVSVELVLQEKNHVIDGKSVEVKRAVPRTDIPPPRSVSSRGDSFSGPSGPGSVGSLDDVCSMTTPPMSLSGSVPSVSGLAAAMGSDKMCRATPTSANLMPNGMLRGYAAAVRYGGQGVSKTSTSNAVLSSSSMTSNSDTSSTYKGISLESSSVSGVADALSSLVLRDSGASCGSGFMSGNGIAASPPLSASSSRESLDHLFDSATVSCTNGHRSPLDTALHPLDNDPVIEQWKLSPSSGPQLASDAPLAPCFESGYLSHGLADGNAESASNLSWQAAPWQQQSWGSPSLPRSQQQQQQQQQHQHQQHQQQQPPLPPTPTSLFSMFSNKRSGGTPLHGPSAWQSNAERGYGYDASTAASDGDGFGSGTMGMGLSIDGGFSGNRVGPGRFGMHSERGDSAPYRPSGGFLQQEYLSTDRSHEQQQRGAVPADQPLDSTPFERLMNSDMLSNADKLRREPSSLDYSLPSSAAEFHREFR